MDKIPFKRIIQQTGNGITVNIPNEIATHYGWKPGDEVYIINDINKKKQLFIAIYKENQKEE